eukprot:CAMPEP_0113493324 /NCGR_PEP_ID=MMETSP0014_2-20120614/28534_1 /TAXON_ID=2857 /ORGANISM="Nitzschia sp." /LENGTH=1368 /DNA_ID=CAMNT_0000387185 /DNA_START=104 /DNA_END=4210 /DNA_ORIENTATION=- /assembly_acc=CAM_ASM_000159
MTSTAVGPAPGVVNTTTTDHEEGPPSPYSGEEVPTSSDRPYDYIFGFGSIINVSTHAPWLQQPVNDEKKEQEPSSSSTSLPGIVVTISKEFGYERKWNFRSTTGFTALGVCPATTTTTATTKEGEDINGVLFRVQHSMIPDFDRREVGYKKVAIPLKFLTFDEDKEDHGNSHDASRSAKYTNLMHRLNKSDIQETDNIWIYVPLQDYSKPADENHPLLQSYVDTVLQGCLEWGGQTMAEDFIRTTGGWSTYFLNDTPSSRRPWLFRKDYTVIDNLLKKHAAKTHYGDRKHPEEFSSAFHRQMKGSWSLPRRNPSFTGRERELQELRSKFMTTISISSSSQNNMLNLSGTGASSSSTVVKVEVAGMGGVGKTSIVLEYCYRFFPSEYGLVVWLNAESAESLVADYRQLLMDLAQEDAISGVTSNGPPVMLRSSASKASSSISSPSKRGGGDNASSSSSHGSGSHHRTSTSASESSGGGQDNTDEIIREVKTRLFRSQVPWLLVFDNLEDRTLLQQFTPRGAGTRGHILVTTRQYDMDYHADESASRTLLLGCFNPTESLELLKRSAGNENTAGETNLIAAKQICDRLGQLPLALGMAAAYMKRCDVQCKEYLDRYSASEQTGQALLRHGKLQDYSLSVSSSLSLSLEAIEKESKVAYGVLRLLSFVGPDQITKSLLRHLLSSADQMGVDMINPVIIDDNADDSDSWWGESSTAAVVSATGLLGLLVFATTKKSSLGASTLLAAGVISLCSFLVPLALQSSSTGSTSINRSSSFNAFASLEYEQADIVWDILKSYSILTVREGKGSMHRLLAESLRSSQSPAEWRYHLRICLSAMETMWTFKTEETKTWKESVSVLEHLKSVVHHSKSCGFRSPQLLNASRLSTDAGRFAAMALNAFIDAQQSFDLSISLLDEASEKKAPAYKQARAEALIELGRVYRYQGKFAESKQSLQKSLKEYESLPSKEIYGREGIADTLHELGVLEVKKHNLDAATSFLEKSLEMRHMIGAMSDESESNSAATLHQLAAICVARKPPSLEKAKVLLQQALSLSRHIGQRAATLKQLARVTIRQGKLDRADTFLNQALDLYMELYGDNKNHINVAAVKFQQGALALQREQWDDAWSHMSDCLRIRRNVYAYAKPVGSDGEDPTHLEVSCVMHELACVAFAQEYYTKALEMLNSERSILERLEEASDHSERIYQARLTNLTWLRKSSKANGDEEAASELVVERSNLKKKAAAKSKEEETKLILVDHEGDEGSNPTPSSSSLLRTLLCCRVSARKLALESDKKGSRREDLNFFLSQLLEEIKQSPSNDAMTKAAIHFRNTIMEWKDKERSKDRTTNILKACDVLRDVLRSRGIQVVDTMCSKRPSTL